MTDAAGAPPRRGAVVAGGVLVGLFGLIIGALGSSFAYDDAWITYRYALNLASGHRWLHLASVGTESCCFT